MAEAVVTVQRDWGDRTNRKHARLKYTIEDRGLDAFRAEVEKRAGVTLEAPKPFTFTSTGDRYGWVEGENGKAHLTLYVPNGRIQDVAGGAAMLTGLRRIAEVHKGDMRLTANQNVIVANVAPEERAAIEEIVAQYRLVQPASGLRRNSMACVALPTCGLALAESERYLPDLIDALDERLAAYGLSDDDIVIRMTGCPNGCARPYLSEIGLVGKGTRPLQPLSRRGVRLLAALEALRRGSAARRNHRGARSAVRRLCEGARAGRALRRFRHPRGLRRAHEQRRATSTPMWEPSAPHERSQSLRPPCAPPAPIAGSGAACSRRRTGRAARPSRAMASTRRISGGCARRARRSARRSGLGTRLLHPMLREDGALVRTDWDTALDKVADGFKRIVERDGPNAVAFYLSGQLLTEDYYVANKLMKGFLGSANVDTNSRLCMASSVAGHRRAFGADTVPGLYEDLDQADLIVLVGSNAAWCHPVLFQRMQQNRRERGAKLVVIDPRRTATADEADLHLAIKPGMDTALFSGLLVRLADRDVFDRCYVAQHTSRVRSRAAARDRDRAGYRGCRAHRRASTPRTFKPSTSCSPQRRAWSPAIRRA